MPEVIQTGNIEAAQWTTAYVNALPDSSFAHVSGDVRKLPYKDKDGKVDLPHVRNALARLNQTQGISDDEKSKIRTKLQGALKNTTAANDDVLRTVNSIQADSTAELPDRVMLLRSGDFHTEKYGVIELTADDLQEMKVNFGNGLGMADEGQTGLPIDYGHKSGENAAGWIRGLEIEADSEGSSTLWGTNVEWSESGKRALAGKEYKCLSSDFYPRTFGQWVDPESGIVAKNVIVGAGLTNKPMFTGNKPVLASEADAAAEGVKTVIYINASEKSKEKNMDLDKLRVKDPDSLKGSEYKFIVENAADLDDAEREKFGLSKVTAAAEKDAEAKAAEDAKKAKEAEEAKKPKKVTASEVTGDEGLVAIEASDLKGMQDSIKALQAGTQASEEKEIKQEVVKAAARGAIKADRVDSWTKNILAAQGEDREALIEDLRSMASNPLIGRKFGSGQTEGDAAMDVEAEITKKVREMLASPEAKKEHLNAFEARKRILAADPELEERSALAARAVLGGFNPFETNWGTNAKGLQGVNPEVTNKTYAEN